MTMPPDLRRDDMPDSIEVGRDGLFAKQVKDGQVERKDKREGDVGEEECKVGLIVIEVGCDMMGYFGLSS
jgi:hypothetical protein